VVHPPSIKSAPEAVTWAAAELATMGGVSRREITMAALAIAALTGWILGGAVLSPVLVSLVVVSLMVITGVVTWNDILANKPGWNVLIWFARLVAMADGLNQVGFLAWFAARSSTGLAGLPVLGVALLLIAIFFVIHYLFASTTAHATAVLPPFLAAIVAVPDMPVRAVAFSIVFSLGLMGVLTPYGTGPAPVWFSAGYISTRDFWKLGAVMGTLFLLVLLAIEFPYLLYMAR
jgi:L-tartrate/succinate antiporter